MASVSLSVTVDGYEASIHVEDPDPEEAARQALAAKAVFEGTEAVINGAPLTGAHEDSRPNRIERHEDRATEGRPHYHDPALAVGDAAATSMGTIVYVDDVYVDDPSEDAGGVSREDFLMAIEDIVNEAGGALFPEPKASATDMERQARQLRLAAARVARRVLGKRLRYMPGGGDDTPGPFSFVDR